jgi:hypothetical protein
MLFVRRMSLHAFASRLKGDEVVLFEVRTFERTKLTVTFVKTQIHFQKFVTVLRRLVVRLQIRNRK